MNDITIASPESLGLSPGRLERIDPWMRALVDSGKLPGVSVLVARRGAPAFFRVYGKADVERDVAMRADTIVRIYSMTKALTSVALMMLYEEGRFQLDDPIKSVLPCFADMRVAVGELAMKIETVPAERDITYRDLLTHTGGLTYGFMMATLVDAAYRDRGVDFQLADTSLADVVEKAAGLPLLSHPGREWNYSISTDVIGHLVAVLSGQSFDAFLQERVIGPLGMVDTGFFVPAEKLDRFAANYIRAPGGGLKLIDDPGNSRFGAPPPICSGGGGLVSTAADYLLFCNMMLNRGVAADGTRLLGRKTVALMTMNHLRGDMADMGQPRFSEANYAGVGFGLGFAVTMDPARAQIVGTPGEYSWGGAASTAFWIDPAEEMVVILLTQLTPSSTYPIRRELRVLTYQALVD